MNWEIKNMNIGWVIDEMHETNFTSHLQDSFSLFLTLYCSLTPAPTASFTAIAIADFDRLFCRSLSPK